MAAVVLQAARIRHHAADMYLPACRRQLFLPLAFAIGRTLLFRAFGVAGRAADADFVER